MAPQRNKLRLTGIALAATFAFGTLPPAFAEAVEGDSPAIDDAVVVETPTEAPSPVTPEPLSLEATSATTTVEQPAADEVDQFELDNPAVPEGFFPENPEYADPSQFTTELLELQSASLQGTTPIYHLYSRKHEEHFFTNSKTERDEILRRWPSAWAYVDEAFYAFSSQVSGTVPVYHLYNQSIEQHHFTSNAKERSDILAKYSDWKDAGVSYYAYPVNENVSGTTQLYRLWSPIHKNRTYTASKAEHDEILRKWPNAWVSEGAQFRVAPAPVAAAQPSKQQRITNLALQYEGVPYYSPGKTPAGWDCSGFVLWVVKNAVGVDLPHSSARQPNYMQRINQSQAVAGDFVAFGSYGSYYHIGIYLGGGWIIHASDWGKPTKIQKLWTTPHYYRLP